MNTQQLESFIQVAENLNFARAAEALNITQSAVSRQIHALEEELGTKLFIRSTRTVSLTPAGLSFFDDAKEIYNKLQMAKMKLDKHSQSNFEIFSIGCINEIYMNLISDILEEYRESKPEVHPFLRILSSRSILNLFFNGEMDVLFSFHDNVPLRSGVEYMELLQMPICCTIPAHHPLSGKERITKQELLAEHMIICNSHALPTKIMDIQHDLGRQMAPGTLNYCENTLAALSLAKAGYGICILPENIIPDPELVYIPISGTEKLSYGVFYKNTSQSHLLKPFLSIARNHQMPGL